MKNILKILILFSIVFLIGSCNDPIFYTVFQETPILKPYIDGSPTNFAIFQNAVYVASGKKIFVYNGKWSEWIKLGDRIGALAATNASLYAFYLENDNNGKIKNLTSGEILDLPFVKSIYADGDVLFVSVRTGADNSNADSYKVYYIKDGVAGSQEIPLDIPDGKTGSWLVGVASNSSNYYLCTISGIYYAAHTNIGSTAIISQSNINDDFTGIISLADDYIAVISNDGRLYEIDSANNFRTVINSEFTDSRSSTGALAVYKNTDNKPSLLLVGRKENYITTSSGYTNGYVEITLDPETGKITGSQFNEPGKNTPSSIVGDKGYERYVSSFGKKPVNHIIQTPSYIDPNMRLFASTQQNGVWSYRDRGEGMVWNAEQP